MPSQYINDNVRYRNSLYADRDRWKDRAQKLESAARKLVEEWDKFNDPNIRVGKVYPSVRELKKTLND